MGRSRVHEPYGLREVDAIRKPAIPVDTIVVWRGSRITIVVRSVLARTAKPRNGQSSLTSAQA